MMRIEPGEFLMGCPAGENGSADERPQHEVRIAQPFWIGKYAVTFDEYDAFAKATGRALPGDRGWGRGRRPVIKVAWGDAVDYARWLAERTGKRYRLPSEAEWEYAARAGTTTPYSTGHRIDRTQANFAKNILQELFGKTLVVGSFPANPWGLHDMHGNVWEWVQDCWHANYEGAPTDGSAWLEANGGDCGRRVARGGAWYYLPEFLRSAYRYGGAADSRSDILGFRLAQDR